MVKQIAIDFFKVKMPDNSGLSFENIIDEISALPDNEDRNVKVRGYPVRLKRYDISGNNREGDVVRIKMDESPLKAKLSGEIEPILFDDDEGLGEETAFYYNSKLKILLLQRNRTGITSSVFIHYFNKMFGKLEGQIILEPILRADAVKRLEEMGIVRKLDIQFAGLNDLSIFRDLNYGVGAIAEISDRFKSPSITLSIGMGRKKGSLDHKSVIASIKQMLGLTNSFSNRIKKIEVRSKPSFEDNIEILNILDYRIVEKASIPLTNKRMLFYTDRREALQTAWKNRHQELTAMFSL